MATLASFTTLPPELRKQMYALVLVESDGEAIGISQYLGPRTDVDEGKCPRVGTAQVARIGHHRKRGNPRGQIWNRKNKVWVPAPPSNTSILRTSKEVHAEAAPVLYGENAFWFSHSFALAGFLFHIGDSKKHLRHIILGGFVVFRNSWASTDRCIRALIEAKSLRTLEIYGCQFRSFSANGVRTYDGASMQELIQHCKPLLDSLHAHIEAKNLNYGILDVVKICFWNYQFQLLKSSQRESGLQNMTTEEEDFVAMTKNDIKKQLQLTEV